MKNFIPFIALIIVPLFVIGQEWDDPITTSDWNQLWRSSFVQGYNVANSPESGQWFWGINMNHSSNNSNYRYNGQIAIKNSSSSPTMYFRSTNVSGIGTWTKVLHNTGDQNINGSLLVGNGNSLYPLLQPGRAATAGSVGYSFNGDTDTGMYNPGIPNTISFATAGQERLKIDSEGKIGIGTISPKARLHVLSPFVSQTSTAKEDANLLIHATSSSRSTSEGAAIGFVLPANTDGSNHWQQGRILVTPDNANSGNASGRMYLQTRYYGSGAWRYRNNLVLLSSGSVGIGTEETGNHELAVEGSIGAREIKVEATGWSDFVFENGYELRTLEEVEKHIKENGHLPEIPSEAEVAENGINLGEMDAKLLQKIEELTLYMIDMNKQVQSLKSENKELKEKVQRLENE